MKTKISALIILLSIGILFLGHSYSSAQSGNPLSRIGVVNIERVSLDCNATKAYIEKAKADAQKLKDEQDTLKKEIQALESLLDLEAFNVGSPDFFSKNRELAQKKSQISYLQDFNQQEQALKNQLWQMDLYTKILKIANELGKEKDLYLVLAVEEPEISQKRLEEFSSIVRSHKVLYSGGSQDLTKAVIDKMNQETQASK